MSGSILDRLRQLMAEKDSGRPRSRSQQEDLTMLASMASRVQDRSRRIKETYAFHIVVEGELPLFMVTTPDMAGGNWSFRQYVAEGKPEPVSSAEVLPICPSCGSNRSQISGNFYYYVCGHMLAQNGQNIRFPLPMAPQRTISTVGAIRTGGKRTVVDWFGNLPEKQEYQRIFKNQDRDVEWGQLGKRSASQMIGPMNQNLLRTMQRFVARHVPTDHLLDFNMHTITQKGTSILNELYLMGGGQMLTGRISMVIGFSTIAEVTAFLTEFRYDYFTFIQSQGRIRVLYRNRLDPRGRYEPILEVQRSLYSSDLSILLANFISLPT